MTKKNEKSTEKKGPALIAFNVKEGRNGGKGFWTRIGAAWAHENGGGFNLQLDMIPLDGKVVLRAPKDDESEG